jgi:hypothetical protein
MPEAIPIAREEAGMAKKETGQKGTMTMREAGHLGGKEVQRQRELRDRKEITDDPYNKPGPAKGEAYGIAAVTQALDGLHFPATKEQVLERAGSQRIHYRKDQVVALRQIIEDAPAEEFPSMAQIVQAVSEALKEEGLSSPTEHA